MDLNEKLQLLRKNKGLTQEEFAEKIFVSRTAVSKWESGRGYPSIDSLKTISNIFTVSIDELLSCNELLTLAENEAVEKSGRFRSVVFGILDCMAALMFILPFFGQKEGIAISSVSLLNLNDTNDYMRTAYISYAIISVVFGVILLTLQNNNDSKWRKISSVISIFISILGTLIFIASSQPYAAVFIFMILITKGVIILKK